MIDKIKRCKDFSIRCEVCEDKGKPTLELAITIPHGYENANDEHHVCLECIEEVFTPTGLCSLDTRISSHIAAFEQELDVGVSYQQRPKGGQQCGPPSSNFCTTPPSAVVGIRRFLKRLRGEIVRHG